MKIFFAPSESKNIPHNSPYCLNSYIADTLHSNALNAYLQFLQKASESEIMAVFGSKSLDLQDLALCQNLLQAPTLEAIRLYSGVAYKALDFESLESAAQEYIRENLYIFSNLFGMVRADEPLAYYNLHQGKGREVFALKTLYEGLKPALDIFFQDCEVLDLRAEAYIKVYPLKHCKISAQVVFLKNGKKVSHYAKFYRGLYARAIAQQGISSIEQLAGLKLDSLKLLSTQHSQNATILTYEAFS